MKEMSMGYRSQPGTDHRPLAIPDTLRWSVLSIGITTLLAACGGTPQQSTQEPAPVSEVFGEVNGRGYSYAARYGDLVWTAGHLPETASPTDSVAVQTE